MRKLNIYTKLGYSYPTNFLQYNKIYLLSCKKFVGKIQRKGECTRHSQNRKGTKKSNKYDSWNQKPHAATASDTIFVQRRLREQLFYVCV